MLMPFPQKSTHIETEAEERTIVQAVLHGDVVEFEILVRRYQNPIYNLMLRVVNEIWIAEDLTQETFVRAYEKLNTYNMRKRFFPWLYTIAINISRDFKRRQGIQGDIFSDIGEVEATTPEALLARNREIHMQHDVKQISDMLMKMPLTYSEPLLLYYREGCTIKEIAAILSISPEAVKVRIHRGREKLKSAMEVSHE